MYCSPQPWRGLPLLEPVTIFGGNMKFIQSNKSASRIFGLLASLSYGALISCAPAKQHANLNSAPDVKSVGILGGKNESLAFQQKNGVVGLLILSTEPNGQKVQSICTGSLISKRLVLTAAHCIADPTTSLVLVVFDVDIEKALSKKNYISASKISAHEAFFPQEDIGKAWNDVGLIELKSDAPATIKIANLPSTNEIKLLKKGVNLTLAGYGITTPIVNEIKIVNGNEVVSAVESDVETSGILRSVSGIQVLEAPTNNKEILIDLVGGKKGACHGDSGGPAYLTRTDGSLALIGVTSRGTNELGNCNEKAIYTNVYGSLGWIKNQAKKWNLPL